MRVTCAFLCCINCICCSFICSYSLSLFSFSVSDSKPSLNCLVVSSLGSTLSSEVPISGLVLCVEEAVCKKPYHRCYCLIYLQTTYLVHLCLFHYHLIFPQLSSDNFSENVVFFLVKKRSLGHIVL